MTTKRNQLNRDEIYLGEFLRLLWKDKILVSLLSIFFSFTGYYYGISVQTKPQIKAFVLVKNAPGEIFSVYEEYLANDQWNNPDSKIFSGNLHFIYINKFNENITSLDTLQNFVSQNNNVDSFKKKLSTDKISAKEYFQNRFQHPDRKNRQSINSYVLIYESDLNGLSFLNNYVRYIQNKTTEDFKDILKDKIFNKTKIYEQNLKIIKDINLEYPLEALERNELFTLGSKILSNRINILNELKTDLENEFFDFNPILDKAKISQVKSTNIKAYVLIGFLGGFFISIIFVLFRSSLKK